MTTLEQTRMKSSREQDRGKTLEYKGLLQQDMALKNRLMEGSQINHRWSQQDKQLQKTQLINQELLGLIGLTNTITIMWRRKNMKKSLQKVCLKKNQIRA